MYYFVFNGTPKHIRQHSIPFPSPPLKSIEFIAQLHRQLNNLQRTFLFLNTPSVHRSDKILIFGAVADGIVADRGGNLRQVHVCCARDIQGAERHISYWVCIVLQLHVYLTHQWMLCRKFHHCAGDLLAESYTGGGGHKIEILNITYAFVYNIPGFIINFFAVTAKPPFTESILFSRIKLSG